jgi:magnesium-transporting ATPase (P-type)
MNSWHALSKKEALKRIESSEEGLTDEEAKARLEKFGQNKIEEVKRKNIFIIFLHEFQSWLIYILLAAAIVSLFIQHYLDAGVILAIIFECYYWIFSGI